MHKSFKSYIPRNQRSTIQNLLYPKLPNNMDFIHHKEYLLQLKKIQKKKQRKRRRINKRNGRKKKRNKTI